METHPRFRRGSTPRLTAVPKVRTAAKTSAMRLSVATCHFPVGADIRRNARYVLHQMRIASKLGADVAHFPEACLSGYAGADFRSFRGFDWDFLLARMQDVLALARQLRLWVVVGSAHRLTGKHKPHGRN